MEVDLEVGLPEAIELKIDDWAHVQELDYEQLPFKCRHCHEYGHFARYCKKMQEERQDGQKGDQWKVVNKNAAAKNKSKNKNNKTPEVEQTQQEQPQQTQEGTSGSKEGTDAETVQSQGTKETTPDPVDQEEGEIQEEEEEEIGEQESPKETSSPPSSPSGKEQNHSPSYADMAKKRPPELSQSSEDLPFEKSSKKQGRRTNKELREEEAENQKMQGSQLTIDMTLNKVGRTRNNRGGNAAPPSGK